MHIFKTDRLKLRELTENDIQLLHEILGDSETMQYYPSPLDLDKTTKFVERNINSYKENGFGLWAVVLNETNKLIGDCGITIQDIDGINVPEIGYHINKNYWRKGFATETANGVMKYGFGNFDFGKLYIHTYIKNIPSKRVAEKIGMKAEKEYDKHLPSHNLIWKHVVYSINKESYIKK